MIEKKGVTKRSGRSWWFLFFFLSLLFMGNNEWVWGARSGKRMMHIPISGTIDSALPFFVKRGIVKAEQFKADIIVLDINTLGGDANAAILIRDALVECKIPTYAYISRAISAGALIALSTDQMWMVKGGTIGAAQPYILGLGGESGKSPVPEGKLISYLSGEFASTARRKGHDQDIARAFVDPDYGLKGIQEKGRPLTLSDEGAMKNNFISGTCMDYEEFLDKIGYKDAERRTAQLSNAEIIARFISNPLYSWIFLVIGILGLAIEFKTPGFGGGGLAGGLSLALFFWGNHIARLTSWFEIILFFIGAVLILIEVFVIPGFGFVGISGIGLVLLSLFLAMLRLPPSGFGFGSWRLIGPLSSLVISLAIATFSIFLLIKYFPKSRLWKHLRLKTEIDALGGHVAPPDLARLLGATGYTESTLRPAGAVRIEGVRYDAKSECGYIQEATPVRVIRIDSASLVVEPVEQKPAEK